MKVNEQQGGLHKLEIAFHLIMQTIRIIRIITAIGIINPKYAKLNTLATADGILLTCGSMVVSLISNIVVVSLISNIVVVSLISNIVVVSIETIETLSEVCPQTHCVHCTNRILRANIRKIKLWVNDCLVTAII
jgi:hypothetical protein